MTAAGHCPSPLRKHLEDAMNGKLRRIWSLPGLVAVAAIAFSPLTANAQPQTSSSYPNRPIRLVVGFAPGGSNDILARVLAERLHKVLGQPVVVENKPGAGGATAASFVKGQEPDGYTLMVGASGAMVVGPAVSAQTPYDTARDFEPISILATFPLVLVVSADAPFKSLPDFIEWTKKNSSSANYASASPTFTLAFELLKLKTGATLQRVSYRGTNDAVVAVFSKQVTAAMTDTLPAMPLVQDGKLRALAVTAPVRLPQLPDVPTTAEAGVAGAEAIFWSGLFAPKGTPKDITARLEAEVHKVMQEEEVRQRLRTVATEAASNTSQEFAARIASELQSWSTVAKSANVQLDQ
jgi:tripartite-type tricarboxylate transporter receptor subunit TctC